MKTLLYSVVIALALSCSPSENSNVKKEATPAPETGATRTAEALPRPGIRNGDGRPNTTSATDAVFTCTSAPNRLCPSDDGLADPSFRSFRRAMIEAVERRDEARLLALIDPRLRTSFGNGGGIAALRASGEPAHSDSAPWRELEGILPLGGGFRGEGADRSFWAPYVYARWPESVDAFSNVVAIRPRVIVRAAPDTAAPEVDAVDWEILELIPNKERDTNPSWRHVRTAKKKDGWVREVDVRSPIGYRAGFSKRSGEWKLEALVAGD